MPGGGGRYRQFKCFGAEVVPSDPCDVDLDRRLTLPYNAYVVELILNVEEFP